MTQLGIAIQPAELSDSAHHDVRLPLESLLVGTITVLIGMRINITHLLTVGMVLSILLLPVWWGSVRRYVGAQTVMYLGVAASCAGIGLSWLAADDHPVGLGTMLDNTILLYGLLTSVGFLLWARDQLGDRALVILFGIGTTIGANTADPLFAGNPWKFGYSTGITLVVLGLVYATRRWALTLALVALLIVISAVTDSRSALGILLLVASFLIWQLRPRQARAGSAIRGLLGLSLLAALAYAVGQALILAGALGAETKARSLQQLDRAGSLILGGRPEIAGTLALMRDNIWGYGSGTRINYHDLAVAKGGMASISYDPNNGYVERYMFGTTYELHSVLGDLWSRFGLLGLALGLYVLMLVLRRLGLALTAVPASAALLYLTTRSLWNMFFSPWYASIGLLALTLALVLRPGRPSGELRLGAGDPVPSASPWRGV